MKVTITQVCRATREITVEMDVPDIDTARKLIEEEELGIPDFDDPRWDTYWDLTSETVEPAAEFHFTKGLPT